MAELFHSDCIKIMKEMPDNHIDVVVTDPPYGLGEWVGKKKSRGNDVLQANGSKIRVEAKEWGVQDWDFKVPDPEYFDEMFRVSKNQVIFGGNYFTDRIPPSSCWIVWDKQNTGNFADCELAYTSFKTAVRTFKYRWNGFQQGIIANKKLNEKRVHPTQKPVPLMEWIIANYTKPGDLILDPFMGSGTTGVACANFGRNFIGVEKVREFFDVASDRIHLAESQINFADFLPESDPQKCSRSVH